jgi:hypothetical protein
VDVRVAKLVSAYDYQVQVYDLPGLESRARILSSWGRSLQPRERLDLSFLD